MLLWAVMQFGSELLMFFGFLLSFFILIIVCSAIERWSKQRRKILDRAVRQSRYGQRTSRQELGDQRSGMRRSTGSWSRSRVPRPSWVLGMPDPSSSPIGGSCFQCGASVHEETSRFCPECGFERQRCPICQRYIARGQDLLTCPYCQVPGHANELIMWVQNKGTCPYCAHKITTRMLVPYQPITNES